MNRFFADQPSAGKKAVWPFFASLVAAVFFLLPATACADSNTTYDVSGTFSNGVIIESGSSFTLTNSGSTTQLYSATLDTSAGDFTCTPSSPHTNTCAFYVLSNGTDFINVPNGTGFVQLDWLQSNFVGFPTSFPLSLGSYILNDGPPATASYLTAGIANLATPEPGTLVLLISGIAMLYFFGLRRSHA